MGLIPITFPGNLSDGLEIQVPGLAESFSITRFAPAVSSAPTTAPCILRVQNASGASPAAYIEATIAQGAYLGTPTSGTVAVAAGASFYLRVVSAGGAGFLRSHVETDVATDTTSTTTGDRSLNDFHSLVRRVLNRGTRFDAEIVDMTRLAAEFIEKNYSFAYMRKVEQTSFASGELELTLASRIKSIEYIRIVDENADPRFAFLVKGDPEDIRSVKSEKPWGYTFIQGSPVVQLQLASLPDADYDVEVGYYGLTSWPTDPADKPWLVQNAQNLLLWQTMLLLVPVVRLGADRREEFMKYREEALRTETLADEELERKDGSHSMGMYVG